MINSITVQALQQKLTAGENIILIDVREHFEHIQFNIGGTLIPLQSIFKNLQLIPKVEPVIVYCARGIRSSIAIQRLQENYNYANLINLEGGMHAWKAMMGI